MFHEIFSFFGRVWPTSADYESFNLYLHLKSYLAWWRGLPNEVWLLKGRTSISTNFNNTRLLLQTTLLKPNIIITNIIFLSSPIVWNPRGKRQAVSKQDDRPVTATPRFGGGARKWKKWSSILVSVDRWSILESVKTTPLPSDTDLPQIFSFLIRQENLWASSNGVEGGFGEKQGVFQITGVCPALQCSAHIVNYIVFQQR